MSTNTALDDIKARVEAAVEARLKLNDSENESQDEALSIRAAFIAEQSSYDVPKLLAALEAVEALAKDAAPFKLFGGATASGIVQADTLLKTIQDALS